MKSKIAINIIGSPGSGKTTIRRKIEALIKEDSSLEVVEVIEGHNMEALLLLYNKSAFPEGGEEEG